MLHHRLDHVLFRRMDDPRHMVLYHRFGVLRDEADPETVARDPAVPDGQDRDAGGRRC